MANTSVFQLRKQVRRLDHVYAGTLGGASARGGVPWTDRVASVLQPLHSHANLWPTHQSPGPFTSPNPTTTSRVRSLALCKDPR